MLITAPLFDSKVELSGVQSGLKSYAISREFDLKSKYDLRPKLHDTKLNNHFFAAISVEVAEFIQYQYSVFDLVADFLKSGSKKVFYQK